MCSRCLYSFYSDKKYLKLKKCKYEMLYKIGFCQNILFWPYLMQFWPVDEPSSPLALYLRFSADFESRVTPTVTVTSSQRLYHSAEVISWHSACSVSYFTCHFTFLLILLFITHFSGVTCGVTLRAVGLADARWPRRALAALRDFISYFWFLALFNIFVLYSFFASALLIFSSAIISHTRCRSRRHA